MRGPVIIEMKIADQPAAGVAGSAPVGWKGFGKRSACAVQNVS
jgi:hypothetical protein